MCVAAAVWPEGGGGGGDDGDEAEAHTTLGQVHHQEADQKVLFQSLIKYLNHYTVLYYI